MKLNLKILLPLLIFILLAIFLGIGLKLNPREVPSVLIDKPVPEFQLSQLYNEETIQAKDLAGQVWILNVWASWCAACLDEHPLLLEVAKNKDSSWQLVGLNHKDENNAAKNWLTKYGGNPYDIILTDLDGRTGIDFGVYGVPETFVIDQDNRIRYKHIGPINATVLTETILPLIDELKN